MLVKTNAVVLHCIKYGESGLIANLYTEQFGHQALLVHGSRKKKSTIHPYLFEPLSLLEINLYHKENRELQILKEVRPVYIFNHLYFDIRKISIALFLGEILFRTLREEEQNLSIFNFLFNGIQILDMIENGLENFPLIFLIQLSKYLGIYPKNDELISLYNTGEGFQITDLLDYSLSDLNTFKISNIKRYEILTQLIRYYSSHFDGLGSIKSLLVLREVYH